MKREGETAILETNEKKDVKEKEIEIYSETLEKDMRLKGMGRERVFCPSDRHAYLLTGALIPWLSLPRPSPSFQPIFISIRKPRFSTVSLNSLYSE